MKPAIRCNKNKLKILAVATTMVALFAVAVGKLADFVVLSAELLTMDPDDIKDEIVIMTVVGGTVVFEE